MNNTVFDRYYEITFTDLGRTFQRSGGSDALVSYTINTDIKEDERVPLQVYGEVKKSLKASGDSPDNVLTLNIANLPKSATATINSASILRVSVALGYKNYKQGGASSQPLSSTVFVGDVKGLETTHNGIDFITHLTAVAGITEKTGATATTVVTAGTSVVKTIKDIAKTFSEVYLTVGGDKKTVLGGVSVVFEGNILSDTTFLNDRSFEGMTTKVLDEICNEFKVSWMYEGDVIHIYKMSERDKVTNYDQLTLEKSNVIGGLGGKFETVGTNNKTSTQASQASANMFLDPRISIQSIINIPSAFDSGTAVYSGNYLPVVWQHLFNYRSGSTWNSKVTMLRTDLKEVENG